MRIKIAENVSTLYAMDKVNYSREFAVMLDAVKGQWLEVETKFLFKDQFNTPPIEGLTEHGLRIHEHWVTEIEDDARIGVCRCHYCGEVSNKPEGYLKEAVCNHCGMKGYLNDLTPKKKLLWSSDNGVWSLVRKYIDGRKQLVVQHYGRYSCKEDFSVDIKSDGTLVYPEHVKIPAYAIKGITKAVKEYHHWSRF